MPAFARGQEVQGGRFGRGPALPLDRDTIVIAARRPARIIVADDSLPLPIECTAYRRGRPLDADIQMRSATGVVTGRACDALYATRSGFDTLVVSAGQGRTVFPVIVAIRPRVDTTGGTTLSIRGKPKGFPWAPTVRRDSLGEIELYAAYYDEVKDTLPGRNTANSNLHRFISHDGAHFTEDGIVVAHEKPTPRCGRRQDGVENMTIVPRVDANGWRMFFSSGTAGPFCPGWEVYSAVSKDAKLWTVEPGVRIANAPIGGDTLEGAWPSGEGIFVRPLLTGNWQMIVSMVQPVKEPKDVFEILEWQSPDQMHWHYIGPSLRSMDMPRSYQGNLMSPSVVELAPGLYRMYFIADNRPEADSSLTLMRSAIWSAVTTDFHSWTIEGQLMGARERWLRYVTVLDDRLYFVSQRLTIDEPGAAIAANDPHSPELGVARLIAP